MDWDEVEKVAKIIDIIIFSLPISSYKWPKVKNLYSVDINIYIALG